MLSRERSLDNRPLQAYFNNIDNSRFLKHKYVDNTIPKPQVCARIYGQTVALVGEPETLLDAPVWSTHQYSSPE